MPRPVRWDPNVSIWKLDTEVTVKTPVKAVDFQNPYLVLSADGTLVLKQGYAWNGCSPKFEILGMVFGTPEGGLPGSAEEPMIKRNLQGLGFGNVDWLKPRTYYASLVHDGLYQISNTHGARMNRKIVDRLFYTMLEAYRFRAARIYYWIVDFAGRFVWARR